MGFYGIKRMERKFIENVEEIDMLFESYKKLCDNPSNIEEGCSNKASALEFVLYVRAENCACSIISLMEAIGIKSLKDGTFNEKIINGFRIENKPSNVQQAVIRVCIKSMELIINIANEVVPNLCAYFDDLIIVKETILEAFEETRKLNSPYNKILKIFKMSK